MEVVIVDDEVSITDLIESYIRFTAENTNVHCFNDALEAREYICNNSIDILITDYKMPGADGIQLLELTSPETRRIMISGYVSEIAVEKLASLNATFFEKPVPMKEIGKLISDAEKALT